ncbi:MAG: HAD family phosphatase [Anaerolineae bacterium]
MFTDVHALIFDMDGVIIDSEPLHAETKRQTLVHYGLDFPPEFFDQFKGMPDHDTFEYVVANYLHDTHTVDEVLAYKRDLYRAIFPKLQTIPGALDFLAEARPRYDKFALTTSAFPENQQKSFARFDLAHWFDVVVTQADVTQHKPHPAPYLKALELLNLPAAACVVIEDSVNGVKSGKAAGCRVIGLTTSFSEEELRKVGADVIVPDFQTLRHLLLT